MSRSCACVQRAVRAELGKRDGAVLVHVRCVPAADHLPLRQLGRRIALQLPQELESLSQTNTHAAAIRGSASVLFSRSARPRARAHREELLAREQAVLVAVVLGKDELHRVPDNALGILPRSRRGCRGRSGRPGLKRRSLHRVFIPASERARKRKRAREGWRGRMGRERERASEREGTSERKRADSAHAKGKARRGIVSEISPDSSRACACVCVCACVCAVCCVRVLCVRVLCAGARDEGSTHRCDLGSHCRVLERVAAQVRRRWGKIKGKSPGKSALRRGRHGAHVARRAEARRGSAEAVRREQAREKTASGDRRSTRSTFLSDRKLRKQ